jgi:cell fate regulator YaaT (PSP1 superfamily)
MEGLVVGVKIGKLGSIRYFLAPFDDVSIGERFVVEIDGELWCGRAISVGVEGKDIEGRIIRKATRADMEKVVKAMQREEEALRICRERVKMAGIPVKVLDTDLTFDWNTIYFYYTSDKKVEMRPLGRDLAYELRAKTKFRRLGARDAARLTCGVGPCGEMMCCASFLHEISSVTIKMAKTQEIPLNSPRILGMCGKLKCCIAYEYPVYKEIREMMPEVGKRIKTDKGMGTVRELRLLQGKVVVELDEGGWVEVDVLKEGVG